LNYNEIVKKISGGLCALSRGCANELGLNLFAH